MTRSSAPMPCSFQPSRAHRRETGFEKKMLGYLPVLLGPSTGESDVVSPWSGTPNFRGKGFVYTLYQTIPMAMIGADGKTTYNLSSRSLRSPHAGGSLSLSPYLSHRNCLVAVLYSRTQKWRHMKPCLHL